MSVSLSLAGPLVHGLLVASDVRCVCVCVCVLVFLFFLLVLLTIPSDLVR